ncbi:hypothetical protein [Methanobrevibacter cuticularis]|nr:hypothetical protein [Methanobrevibacter cuticularis]
MCIVSFSTNLIPTLSLLSPEKILLEISILVEDRSTLIATPV